MQRTISRTKMPSSFFIGPLSAAKRHKKHKSRKSQARNKGRSYFCVICAFLWLILGAGGETHDGLFAELRAIKNSGEPSLVHDCYAVANAEHLFHLTTYYNH